MERDPEDPLAVLRRWEASGGVLRVAVRTPKRVEVDLLTCDAGEVMGKVRAAPPDPELLDYVTRAGS
jgi:hypothetical protein